MIEEATKILSLPGDLSAAQMGEVMEEIMGGKVNTPQIVSFLKALTIKGETAQELIGAVSVMRLHAVKINTCAPAVLDTCGTGGDLSGTFNISTASAFVASACGITVAKHGNRSLSSASGSVDILEALGININMKAQRIEESLRVLGIAFLFAPNLHPAMKYAMAARKEIGKRTIFNLLGPLSNPAEARHQLVGVYEKRLAKILANALRDLGSKHALVVHGDDGLDEITITAETFIAETYQDKIKTYKIAPEDFKIKRANLNDLKGGNAAENAKILTRILKGETGPKRDIVVLNAAAAIYAADKSSSIAEAIGLAQKAIDTKKALEKLLQLKDFSHK